MKLIILLLVALGIAGCAHKPVPAPSTAPVAGHIDNAYNALSGADGKAVLIESWIR